MAMSGALLGGLGGGLGGAGMGGGFSQLLSGIFGNSGAPFQAGMDQLQKYYGQAQGYQNPFYNAGTQAIPQYQNWVNTMKDPSSFINNLMGHYQESPWAQYQQQQAQRANTNMASASGLIGSTPWQLQGQQNAQNISSQDMNQWLQNVLGINTQYGAGLGNQVGIGQNAANNISNMLTQLANSMAQGAYGEQAGENQDQSNIVGGIGHILFG